MKSSENHTNKIRLSIFTPTLDGGVGRVVATIASGLSALGFETTLLVPSWTGDFADTLPADIAVHSFDKTRTVSCLVPLAKYFQAAKPEVLLSVSFHANCVALLARAYARAGSIPLVISEHINLSQALGTLGLGKRFVMRVLVRTLYPRADARIAVSRGAADTMARYAGVLPQKVDVLYNPVALADVAEASRAEIFHPWFIAKEIPVLAAVGRLDAQKDYPTLLRACKDLMLSRPVRLIVCGDGPLRDSLSAYAHELGIADSVHFLGFVKNPFPYIRLCDAFVLSSAFEGLPTVLIEALAVGTPIMSTDCPDGPREILAGGRYGKLVPVGDHRALSLAIEETLEHPEAPDSREATLPYEMQTACGKYAELIARVLKGRKADR